MGRPETKDKRLNLRMTNSTHSDISRWANKNDMSLSEAAVYLIEKGIEAETEPKATRADVQNVTYEIQAIKTEYEKSNLMLLKAIQEHPVQVIEAPKKSFLDRFKRKDKSHE